MSANSQTDDRPVLTSLVTGIIDDAQNLIGQQLALFQHEIKEDFHRTKEAVLPLAVGMGIAFIGLVLLGVMAAHLLPWIWPRLPLWAGFAIVGGVFTILGGGLICWAKKQFDAFNPLPDKTLASLKENVQWIATPK
jgi:hypothetical protein